MRNEAAIKITREQKRLLNLMKIHPKQPYYEIIQMLLEPFTLPEFTKEEGVKFMRKIRELRSTIKRKGGGKT